MMPIVFTNYFSDALDSIINYLDEVNIQGAGNRWFVGFEKFLHDELRYPKAHSLCNNKAFKQFGLHCIFYKDWTIAFRITIDQIILVTIIHKNNIID